VSDLDHRYRPQIRKIVRNMLGHSKAGLADADDLEQQALVRLLKNKCRVLANFIPNNPHSERAYIKKVATSVVLDYFKQDFKRGVPLEEAVFQTAPDSSVEDRILLRELEEALFEAIRDSPNGERDRKIFLLHYRSGLTAKQIAGMDSIGLSTKGVESALRKMVALIQDSLQIKPKSDKNKNAGAKALQEQL
jgi:RNA polymerase sigma factor (sigma-70 family)